MVRKLSAAYTGGVIGALIDSFNIWILGKAGLHSLLGIGLQLDGVLHRRQRASGQFFEGFPIRKAHRVGGRFPLAIKIGIR